MASSPPGDRRSQSTTSFDDEDWDDFPDLSLEEDLRTLNLSSGDERDREPSDSKQGGRVPTPHSSSTSQKKAQSTPQSPKRNNAPTKKRSLSQVLRGRGSSISEAREERAQLALDLASWVNSSDSKLDASNSKKPIRTLFPVVSATGLPLDQRSAGFDVDEIDESGGGDSERSGGRRKTSAGFIPGGGFDSTASRIFMEGGKVSPPVR